MKKEIDQLKKLALKCAEFAKEMNLPNRNISEFISNDTQFSIYCADNHETIVAYFGPSTNRIEVHLYSDKITIPMSMTLKEIKEKLIGWAKLIEQDFDFEIEKYKIQAELIKQKKIEDLEKELKFLKLEKTTKNSDHEFNI